MIDGSPHLLPWDLMLGAVVPSHHVSSWVGDTLGLQESVRVMPPPQGSDAVGNYREQYWVVVRGTGNLCGVNCSYCRILRRTVIFLLSNFETPTSAACVVSDGICHTSHFRVGLRSY